MFTSKLQGWVAITGKDIKLTQTNEGHFNSDTILSKSYDITDLI